MTDSALLEMLPLAAIRLKRERERPIRPPVVAWQPLPGPQQYCYASPADIVFYGGQAGGGKTDLLLGLAMTAHRKAIIFRREFPQFREILQRSTEIVAGHGRFSGQSMTWRLEDGRMLEFGAVQYPGSVQKYQGRPHDFIGFDELSHFTEAQFRFLVGWLRTTDTRQRCRIVATGNPPMDAAGEWILQYWGPWLDPQHPHPAEPGELRWYATLAGKDVARPDGAPFAHEGETIQPMSRTFIPATVDDNPYLRDSGYKTILQNLPEPLRSKLLLGDFAAGQEDNPWQVIPTAWVDAAMARWQPEPPQPRLTSIGVDVARGGKDNTVIARRYGPWFAPLIVYPGTATPDGPRVASLVLQAHEGGVPINVDVVGVGTSVYDCLNSQRLPVNGINGAERSELTDRTGRLRFRNKRAELYWRFREALDPTTGEELALPPDRDLRTDLIAPRWKLTAQGIQVEAKEDIIARIERSPDRGDAVVYALDSFYGDLGISF